jgi:hypothetical protein
MKISGNYRSPQVDIIRIGEDGTLNQVTGTMKGPSQLKALNPYDGVSGCTMASQAGIQYEKGEGWQGSKGTTGSWIRIAGVDFGRGTERLTVSTVSETDSELYLMTGGPDGEVAAMINVPAGTEPVLTEAPLTLEGEQDICFVFGGDMTFINWKVQ